MGAYFYWADGNRIGGDGSKSWGDEYTHPPGFAPLNTNTAIARLFKRAEMVVYTHIIHYTIEKMYNEDVIAIFGAFPYSAVIG